VVPVLRVNRAAVSHHFMARLALETGAVLELSPSGAYFAGGALIGSTLRPAP